MNKSLQSIILMKSIQFLNGGYHLTDLQHAFEYGKGLSMRNSFDAAVLENGCI